MSPPVVKLVARGRWRASMQIADDLGYRAILCCDLRLQESKKGPLLAYRSLGLASETELAGKTDIRQDL